MPKIVDHQARRDAVADIAATHIARHGLEAASIREIARAADCSTSIVSHYFRGKQDLLLSAYRLRMEETVAEVERAAQAGGTLVDCIGAILPLDERRADRWRIWLAFWGRATGDDAFLTEQKQRSREAVDLFHRAVLQTGAMEDGEKARLVAQALLSNVAGIATQAVFDPEGWPAARQLEILRLVASSLIPEGPAA